MKCGVKLLIYSQSILQPTFYWVCDNLSMLGLDLINVYEKGRSQPLRESTQGIISKVMWSSPEGDIFTGSVHVFHRTPHSSVHVWITPLTYFLYKILHFFFFNFSFFMPPPLGAGGIMFSGCPSVRPSVRSLKYPLLTCTWVRWSTRPTVTVLRHVRPSVRPSVCPSVRPERFPGICRRTHGGNGLKFYVLMYLDRLQNWLVYGHGLLIFLILVLFWLSETGQIWGFRAFPGECKEIMASNFARWCILTTFRTD